MSTLDTLLSSPLLGSLSQALLHFVWQGALLAVLFAAAARSMAPCSARARYALGCLTLALMAAAPIATLGWLMSGPISVATAPETIAAGAIPSIDARRWLVLAWGAGVLVLLLRTCGGLIRARSWCDASSELDPRWQLACQRLSQQLGIRALVRLVVSRRVTVPTAIGWLKPVIVFPLSVITALSTAQIESILAHELAHIRRRDYLVNLLQVAVETLLFYHPAVWWVSRCIRLEREYCCDDLAVSLCGNAITYAQALTALEERRSMTIPLAVSSAGGSLMNRIRRLVGMPPLPARHSASATLLLTSSLLALCLLGLSARGVAGPPMPSPSGGGDDDRSAIDDTAPGGWTVAVPPLAGDAESPYGWLALSPSAPGKTEGDEDESVSLWEAVSEPDDPQRCDCCQKCEAHGQTGAKHEARKQPKPGQGFDTYSSPFQWRKQPGHQGQFQFAPGFGGTETAPQQSQQKGKRTPGKGWLQNKHEQNGSDQTWATPGTPWWTPGFQGKAPKLDANTFWKVKPAPDGKALPKIDFKGYQWQPGFDGKALPKIDFKAFQWQPGKQPQWNWKGSAPAQPSPGRDGEREKVAKKKVKSALV